MEIKEFSVGSLLGEGSFSKFYKVKRKSDRRRFVLKKTDVTLAVNKKAASQEIALQGLLEDSDSFVKLFGHFVAEPGLFYLLFEYCKERDLQLLINKAKLKNEHLQDAFILRIVRGITQSLLYLEEREILHTHVKPSSIFLTSDFNPKLSDFTYAHYAVMPPTVTAKTSPFTPPEIVLQQPVSFKTDVWSIGCVAYALHQLNPPFSGTTEEIRMNICGRNIRVAVTRENCQGLFDFIGPMMATNSFFRPTFREVLQHPILQSIPTGAAARPFKPLEEITKIISKINIQSGSTDSGDTSKPTTAKLNPYFVSRPGNFPLPPRKVRFLNDGSKEVSYKWYDIESKQKIETLLTASSKSCIKPEPLPFLNEIRNFKSDKATKKCSTATVTRGNYTKDDLEKAVAEKLAVRKFTMKYLRQTGKENFVVKHTKL